MNATGQISISLDGGFSYQPIAEAIAVELQARAEGPVPDERRCVLSVGEWSVEGYLSSVQHFATAADQRGIDADRQAVEQAVDIWLPLPDPSIKPAVAGLGIVAPENHRLGRF